MVHMRGYIINMLTIIVTIVALAVLTLIIVDTYITIEHSVRNKEAKH